jgi:hypothetical protein
MVEESEIIRTQMGSATDQKITAIAGVALYDTTP